ncbi:MAG TPA: hypothetical protein VF795_00230, partial [Desulfuromonadaceae bacterium]
VVSCIAALLVALTMLPRAEAAFAVGGENGWQLTTDGIVDVFSTYNSTSRAPDPATHGLNLLGGSTTGYDQRFGIGIGLLPSVVGFTVKAPTTNGVDSSVRIGIYPAIQNTTADRFNTAPNIDFREIYYTAKGKYGELLAGRALNLFMGKNILTDMTLLTAGVVPGPGLRGNTTLGHIGYGYLYANFGPQIRYTTPDLGGVKVALEVGEPYNITADTGKTNSPRVETEISYATVFNGGNTVQAWLSGLYQTAPRKDTAAVRPGSNDESIGGAYGVSVGIGGVNLLFSGYGGRGLGMVSAQDGDLFGTAEDANGTTRLFWGFLAQATYKLTSDVMVGVNYGQSRMEQTDFDAANVAAMAQIKNQEAGTANVTYNFNKFTQFIIEYTYAQNTWYGGAKQHSNQFALGTMFYW